MLQPKEKKGFISRLRKPTPKKWLSLAKISGSIGTALTAGLVAIKALSITYPEQFDWVIGGIIFISVVVATYAKQKVEPDPQKIQP